MPSEIKTPSGATFTTFGDALAHERQSIIFQETIREIQDPRFQTAITTPSKAKEAVKETPSFLKKVIGRFKALNDKEKGFREFVKQNSILARIADERMEDVRIRLKDMGKRFFKPEEHSTTEELMLAKNMAKVGLQREASEMLEQIEDRRVEDLTERQIKDIINPPSKLEMGARAVTQTATEVAVPILLTRRLPSFKGIRGTAMKNLLAEEVAESFAIASWDKDLNNVNKLPEEFFDDLKFALPFVTALKVGGAALTGTADAYRKMVQKSQDLNVQMTPQMFKEGMGGVPSNDFARVFGSLDPRSQKLLTKEFKRTNDIKESRLAYFKSPEDAAKQAGERSMNLPKPRSDVPQEFRSDKLDLPPDSEAKVRATFEALGLDSRKVQTFDDVKQLADEIGADPRRLLRDMATNDLKPQEVLALRDAINASSQYLSDLHKRLDEAKLPSDKEKILQRAAEHEAVIQLGIRKLTKGGTQAGRTVSAYRLIARNNLDPTYWLKEAERVMGGKWERMTTEELDDVVIGINDLIRKKDTIGLANYIATLKESDNVDKAITLWKAGLLTSPTTHIANLLGNTSMQALETVKDIPATAIDWGLSKITGRRTKALTLQNFAKQAKGHVEGVQKAKDYFKTGIDAEGTLGKYDIPKMTNYNNAYLQNYTDLIFRSLGAGDKVFRYGTLRKSLYEQAVAKVKNLSPESKAKALAELSEEYGTKATDKDLAEMFFKNPDDGMAKIAIDDAEYATFLRENELASFISKGKRGRKPVLKVAVEIAAPFTRTPTNVALTIADYSPLAVLNMLSSGLKKDQKAFSEAFGRGITGSAVIALGAALGREGKMTGVYPSSEAERELWHANGISQQSILFNGKWRRLDRMSPIGNLLAMGAEFNRFGKDRTTVDKFSQTAFSGLKGLTEQSFLRGASSMLKAVTEPERYAGQYIARTTSSVIPSFIGRIAQGVDTKRRDPETFAQIFAARVPFLAEEVPAKINVFGREVPSNQGVVGRIADPFTSSPVINDFVAAELLRLNHPIPIGRSKIMNDREHREFLKMRGTIMNPLLYSTMGSLQYGETFTDDQRNYAIDGIVSLAAQGAREYVKFNLTAPRIAKELMNMSPHDREVRFQELRNSDSTTSQLVELMLQSQQFIQPNL